MRNTISRTMIAGIARSVLRGPSSLRLNRRRRRGFGMEEAVSTAAAGMAAAGWRLAWRGWLAGPGRGRRPGCGRPARRPRLRRLWLWK